MTRAKPVPKPPRIIALIAGASGTGKSFFVANLKNALIFDTDIGGGLEELDQRIARNGSERVEVGSWGEIVQELTHRRGQLKNIGFVAIDHATNLHQEEVIRGNPDFREGTFGREHEKAAKHWRKTRELLRRGDFHLIVTAHLKTEYQNNKAVGITEDASKNIAGDFKVRLHLQSRGPRLYPSTAHVIKWRRDPEDERGEPPASFLFTMENFLQIHGAGIGSPREEVPGATPAQVAEIERLLAVVKLPEGTTEAWLSKAKADSWDEFSEVNLQKCIDHLKGLIANGKKETA